MKMLAMRVSSVRQSLSLGAAMILITAPPVHGQRLTPVVQAHQLESRAVQRHLGLSAGSTSSHKTAKGAGIGLLAGALAGVAVAAVIEAGNEGGLPEIRERERGLAYAVFVPTGAVLGAVVGAVIGARRH